jgi:hypothetical protein
MEVGEGTQRGGRCEADGWGRIYVHSFSNPAKGYVENFGSENIGILASV